MITGTRRPSKSAARACLLAGLFALSLPLVAAEPARAPVPLAPQINVVAPDGRQPVLLGAPVQIRWQRVGRLPSAVSIQLIRIESAGPLRPRLIVRNTPNSGAYTWTPGVRLAPGSYQVRVLTTDRRVAGTSPQFALQAPPPARAVAPARAAPATPTARSPMPASEPSTATSAPSRNDVSPAPAAGIIAGSVHEEGACTGTNLGLGVDCKCNSECASNRCDAARPEARRCIPNDGEGRPGDYCSQVNQCSPLSVCRDDLSRAIVGSARPGTCVARDLEYGDQCYNHSPNTRCKSTRCDTETNRCIANDGQGPEGAYCSHDNQCASTMCLSHRCVRPHSRELGQYCGGYDRSCLSGRCDAAPGNPQRCIPDDDRGDVGDYCTHDNQCGNKACINNQCATRGDTPLGTSCSNDAMCVSGRCDAAPGNPRRCIPNDSTGETGDYCSHDNHCGLRICLAQTCAAPLSVPLGEACAGYNSVCSSRRCDGATQRCIPNDGEGQTNAFCTHNNHCVSGICLGNACRAHNSRNLGETCAGYNALCVGSAVCDAASNRCVPEAGTGALGDFCTGAHQCQFGVCAGNQCSGSGARALGQACTQDTQCVSSRCDNAPGNPRRCIPNDGQGMAGDYCTHNNHCRPPTLCRVAGGGPEGVCN